MQGVVIRDDDPEEVFLDRVPRLFLDGLSPQCASAYFRFQPGDLSLGFLKPTVTKASELKQAKASYHHSKLDKGSEMNKWTIQDRYGNIIYLIEECWHHIWESRPELELFFDEFLNTIQSVQHKQDDTQ